MFAALVTNPETLAQFRAFCAAQQNAQPQPPTVLILRLCRLTTRPISSPRLASTGLASTSMSPISHPSRPFS
ncbi:hypothetical protein FRC12_001685 [Ceratobasidium sp. 428]|nr:hypothetical protein FRC12_001685 [Ceratobasidium sp. 428]